MSNSTDLGNFFDNSQMNIIGVISLMTSGLSLLGSGSILFCVVYHQRICTPEIFPMFHLSLADAMASLFMIVVSALFLGSYPSPPGSSGPCGYVIAIMTILYISTFFLTLGYALEAFIRLRHRLQTYLSMDGHRRNGVSNYCMYVVYFFSWMVPIALGVFLMVVTHSIKEQDAAFVRVLPRECSLCFPVFSAHQTYCWSHVEKGRLWLLLYRLIFLIPLIFVFTMNMVLYICIARDFRQVSMRRGLLSYHQRQEEATLRKKAFMYQFAFLICWIPTMILECASFFSSYTMSDFYALFILQALLGPMQGLLNCIIYGWKRDSFRRALSESSHLLNSNPGGAGMSFTL